MHVHTNNAMPCFVLITKYSRHTTRFCKAFALPDVQPFVNRPWTSRLVHMLQRKLIVRGHLFRQNVLIINVRWSGISLSTTDDGELDLVELFTLDACALGQSFLGLLEYLAFFQQENKRYTVVFRGLLLIVETRNESIGRVLVCSSLILWYALGVNGHVVVDISNRIGFAEQFGDSSRMDLEETNLLDGLIG